MRPFIHPSQIDQAVAYLKQGELVAIPTETVYGLAADASNDLAVKKIFTAKGRPATHPLIVHIKSMHDLSAWAIDIPDYALHLAAKYWPGPMTLILKKQAWVLDSVTAQQNSIGLRVPQHPVAQQLLHAFQGGLAAPSANKFGRISPTTAKHVHQHLDAQIAMILDGGDCGIGIESTIIDCLGTQPRILRPGMLILDPPDRADMDPKDNITTPPCVPGALPSHYAPHTPTYLLSSAEIDQRMKDTSTKNRVILSLRKPMTHSVKLYDSRIPHHTPCVHPDIVTWIVMPNDAHAYAHRFYQQLHFADSLQCHEILIEQVPDATEWRAILDRITKAST